MMAPNYRADMWAPLDSDATLSAATLARETYGSFATAWHVRRDFLLLGGASSLRTPPSEPKKKPAASISGVFAELAEVKVGSTPTGPNRHRPYKPRRRRRRPKIKRNRRIMADYPC